MSSANTLAVIGSTGAVGQEVLDVLERRSFPLEKLILFGSSRSAGKKQKVFGREYTVQELQDHSFQNEKIDIALFCANSATSRRLVPKAVESGSMVVDNSSAFRLEKNIPLVIPEVNEEELQTSSRIIANPNCSTIIMLMAIAPVHKINPIQKIVVSTYQAASGAGREAMKELESQSLALLLEKKKEPPKIFPHPIAFNVFSHNSALDFESGYNGEEQKMIHETQKILKMPDLPITATCIRIGVFRAHAESLHLELKNKIDLDAVKDALQKAQGIRMVDDLKQNLFPMPSEASGKDEVLVGRVRVSLADPSGRSLDLWCCGDQLLKGAALNAVQIAEKLI